MMKISRSSTVCSRTLRTEQRSVGPWSWVGRITVTAGMGTPQRSVGLERPVEWNLAAGDVDPVLIGMVGIVGARREIPEDGVLVAGVLVGVPHARRNQE